MKGVGGARKIEATDLGIKSPREKREFTTALYMQIMVASMLAIATRKKTPYDMGEQLPGWEITTFTYSASLIPFIIIVFGESPTDKEPRDFYRPCVRAPAAALLESKATPPFDRQDKTLFRDPGGKRETTRTVLECLVLACKTRVLT